MSTRDEIRDRVVEALGGVVGDDTIALLGVSEPTRLFTDLQLGSIEIVSLIEAISKYYPLGDEFFAWVSKLSYREMARLSVGDIVDFIDHAQH